MRFTRMHARTSTHEPGVWETCVLVASPLCEPLCACARTYTTRMWPTHTHARSMRAHTHSHVVWCAVLWVVLGDTGYRHARSLECMNARTHAPRRLGGGQWLPAHAAAVACTCAGVGAWQGAPSRSRTPWRSPARCSSRPRRGAAAAHSGPRPGRRCGLTRRGQWWWWSSPMPHARSWTND